MTSSACTDERRRGISTVTPRRASLYARSPPILTADAAGIGSSISPRRGASRASSRSRGGGSERSITSPSGSPVEVRAVRSTSVTYRLSRPTKHDASLVASPDNNRSKPVAKGSSVPAWPVRAPVRRRTSATIANDDGPAGLSTRITPEGLRPRGGKLPPHEVGDLLDRPLAREPGSLAVPPAARFARDRRHVELVDARAEAHAARRPVGAWRLADQHRHVGALDRSEVVDDPFRVGLGGSDVGEVRPQQVRDDDATAFVHLRPLERAREQLELCELHRLVHALEHAMHVGAGLDELGGKAERLRRRVGVLVAARVGDERDVEWLGDDRLQIDITLDQQV